MRVFSSIRSEDIDAATPSRGAQLLRQFLAYAEHGTLDGVIATAGATTESPFEAQVLLELTRRGLKLVPQVGASGYRIDFGALDDAHPGRYICGIECDGVAYHSSETARDRDRLRQQVLEDRGWIIHRIWSTDWFKDRAGQIERILRLVDQSRERVDRVVAEQAAREAPVTMDVRSGPTTDAAPQSTATAGIHSRSADPENPAFLHGPTLSGPRSEGYVPPTAAPYLVASISGSPARQGVLEASSYEIQNALVAVVDQEGPIHEQQLLTRVAGLWGNRAGPRIAERILEACGSAVSGGRIRQRGRFLWPASGQLALRDRSAFPMPAEQICPEEYREAALAVLRTGYGFSREELKTEVRSLLGFSRTGHLLEAEIERAIEGLLAEGVVGEASSGIRLRVQ